MQILNDMSYLPHTFEVFVLFIQQLSRSICLGSLEVHGFGLMYLFVFSGSSLGCAKSIITEVICNASVSDFIGITSEKIDFNTSIITKVYVRT